MGIRVKLFFPEDRYVNDKGALSVAYPMIYIGDEKFRTSSVHNYGDGMVEISFMVRGTELEIIEEKKDG